MPRPVLLLAFANDRVAPGRFLRSLNAELKSLRDALADDQGRAEHGEPRWNVHDVPDATLDDLLRALRRHANRVVLLHYGGHAGDYELLLQSPDGGHAVTHAGGLAVLLGAQHGLRCVFLNGCSTHGHVRDLLAAGVPAVIATRREIEDALALDFARHFYEGLAAGASLGRAFDEATAALRARVGDGVAAGNGSSAIATSGPRGFALDAPPPAVPNDVADRVPWELHVAEGAAVVREWSLAVAAGDPLFGLTPLAPRDLPPSPFRHLRWYTRDDAELFFGRGAEIRALHEHLTAAAAAPIVLLYGQSGAGKSSLLDAGLQPRLETTHDVRYARRDERVGLGATLRRALGGESSGIAASDAGSLGTLWARAETAAEQPVVVILDQVEETFTRPLADTRDELDTFVGDLVALFRDPGARPRGRLVLGFRKEWLAELTRRLAEARLPYREVFVDRLGRSGIVEAVTGPARMRRLRDHYRLTVDDGLAEIVADDLLADATSPVAPTLQVLLSKLWDDPGARRDGRVVFDAAHYQRLKDGGILLGDFLDEQLGALETWLREAYTSGLALDVLHAHTTELGTARSRGASELAARYAHHGALIAGLVEQCRQRFLLADVPRATGEEPATTLAHDTLAPLVRRRYDRSALAGQRALRVLESRRDEWSTGAVGRTLDATDLAVVEAGRDGMRDWTPDEARLVAASRIACAAKARERAWRRRVMVGGSLLVAALGIAAGVTGVQARRDSRRAHAAAVVSVAASQPDAVDAALLLATLAGEPEPPGALQTALALATTPIPTAVVGGGEEIGTAFIAADARGVVTAPARVGLMQAWQLDARGGRGPVARAPIGNQREELLAIDAAGHRALLHVSIDGIRRLFLAALDGSGSRVEIAPPCLDIASGFVADGRAWTLCRDSLVFWRVDTIARHAGAVGSTVEALDGTVSADGRRAAVTYGGGAIAIVRLDSVAGPSVHVGSGVPGAMRLTADGSHLAILDRSLRIVRTDAPDSGRVLAHIGSASSEIIDLLAISPDGRSVVTVDGSGTPTLRRGLFDVLRLPHVEPVLAAAFGSDGRSVVTVAGDGAARTWDVDGSRLARRLPADRQRVRLVAFSPDGRRVLSASDLGTLVVQNADGSGDSVVVRDSSWSTATQGANLLLDATFAPDGRRVLAIARDDTIRAWSADRAGAAPLRMSAGARLPDDARLASLHTAVFSRDGQRVVTIPRYARTPIRVRTADGFGDTLSLSSTHRTTHAVLAPDGRTLVAAGTTLPDSAAIERPQVRARHIDGSWRAWPLDAYVAHVTPAADGRHVLVAAGRSVHLLHPDSARLRTFTDASGDVRDASLDSAGQLLAIVSADSTVTVRRTDRSDAPLVLRLPGDVRRAALSPDGSRLVTGGRDGVRVWMLRWEDVVAELARSTSACLSEAKRRIFLAESVRDARDAWERCERSRGRAPTPR